MLVCLQIKIECELFVTYIQYMKTILADSLYTFLSAHTYMLKGSHKSKIIRPVVQKYIFLFVFNQLLLSTQLNKARTTDFVTVRIMLPVLILHIQCGISITVTHMGSRYWVVWWSEQTLTILTVHGNTTVTRSWSKLHLT